MKSAVVATLVAFAAAQDVDVRYHDAFTTFIKQYQKSYPIEEVFSRFNIFKANLDRVEQHNAEGHPWTMGINEFADLTADEFKANYYGLNHIERDYATSRNSVGVDDFVGAVAPIDWTTKGVVTPVKNQGQCGSCWAFSTTGSVEGAVAIKTGKLPNLSEQQLVDCSGSTGNQGCNGGLMDQAFEWIVKNGICSEASYPYKGTDGTCKSSCTEAATISGYKDVDKTEAALAAAVMQQPISIAIEADQFAFQLYKSGVLTGKCGKNLDHGVLLVGQGTDGSLNYWKVKNSWGATWGEAGYIRLVQGIDQCGLTQGPPSFPIA